MWATFAIFQKLPKVNNDPLVENSPSLVALLPNQPVLPPLPILPPLCSFLSGFLLSDFELLKLVRCESDDHLKKSLSC
jgi:hypothetical protein